MESMADSEPHPPMHRGGPLDLDELEALAIAATPGPWRSFIEGRDHTSGDDFIQTAGDGEDLYPRVVAGPSDWNANWRADQDFIAAASPVTVLDLIARLRSTE